MRFRANTTDGRCLDHFSGVNTIARLAKTCTLRLMVDKPAVATLPCELSQGNVFDEFLMEGTAAEKIIIYLELTPGRDAALKTECQGSEGMASSSPVVAYDIPVGIIPRKLLMAAFIYQFSRDHKEEEDKQSLQFYSNRIKFNGEMNLKTETDLVCVTTHFKELGNPPRVGRLPKIYSQERDHKIP
uniref:Checkpoint protein n=1 Tax=Podarcis muralis TaxID=64176 RepID=A0A670KB21_PODMU